MLYRKVHCFEPCAYEIDKKKSKLLIEAFKKVYENVNELNEF